MEDDDNDDEEGKDETSKMTRTKDDENKDSVFMMRDGVMAMVFSVLCAMLCSGWFHFRIGRYEYFGLRGTVALMRLLCPYGG
jgi:hypothetical protein